MKIERSCLFFLNTYVRRPRGPAHGPVPFQVETDRDCRGLARSRIRTRDYVLPTVRCAPIEPPGRLEVRIEFCEVSSET